MDGGEAGKVLRGPEGIKDSKTVWICEEMGEDDGLSIGYIDGGIILGFCDGVRECYMKRKKKASKIVEGKEYLRFHLKMREKVLRMVGK